MFRLLTDVQESQLRYAAYDDSAGADETLQVGELCTSTGADGMVTVDSTNAGAAVIAADDLVAGLVVGWSGPNGEIIDFGTDPNQARPSITIPDGNPDNIQVIYVPITRNIEFEGLLDADSGTTGDSDFPLRYFDLNDASTIDESSDAAAATTLKVFSLGLMPGEVTGSRRVRVKIRRALDLV